MYMYMLNFFFNIFRVLTAHLPWKLWMKITVYHSGSESHHLLVSMKLLYLWLRYRESTTRPHHNLLSRSFFFIILLSSTSSWWMFFMILYTNNFAIQVISKKSFFFIFTASETPSLEFSPIFSHFFTVLLLVCWDFNDFLNSLGFASFVSGFPCLNLRYHG